MYAPRTSSPYMNPSSSTWRLSTMSSHWELCHRNFSIWIFLAQVLSYSYNHRQPLKNKLKMKKAVLKNKIEKEFVIKRHFLFLQRTNLEYFEKQICNQVQQWDRKQWVLIIQENASTKNQQIENKKASIRGTPQLKRKLLVTRKTNMSTKFLF